MVRHCLWKMCATTGACIKPGCAARRLLCRKVNLLSCVARRPLCKVNLPICEARRRHFIMTCDIFGVVPHIPKVEIVNHSHFGTGHTNIIRKNQYKPAHRTSHWNQHTRPNYWKSYWREPHTHSTEGFDGSLAMCEIERCSSSRQFIVLRLSPQKMWSRVFNINTS